MKIFEEPKSQLESPTDASTQTQWALQVVSPRIYNLYTGSADPGRQVKNVESMDSRGQAPVLQENSTAKVNENIEQGYVGPFQCHPMQVKCPQCKNTITTITSSKPNALCLLCFGLFATLFDECHNVEHRCPRCSAFLGVYKPT